MVRRTKEEALETRNKLLDSAEVLFQSQGVSRTTLQNIAQHAGVTRGAVYWHFKDKADLFDAMMERVTLPLESYFSHEQSSEETSSDSGTQALMHTRNAILKALHQIVNDPQTRSVLEIATQKVEYIEGIRNIRLRHLTACNGFLCRVTQGLDTASRQKNLTLPVPSVLAARGLHALIDGLIQNWLLDPQAFELTKAGQSTMDIYFKGLGFKVS
ncbi:TetR family transcriptional regulator [Polaromonas sp. CG_23.6]|uniref:TetR family transcriptional regulator n=1 Tax=Polaromonas sp. CG_23.6 TaxID=2760709 RepID=UPI0024766F28|nr:TetR family transcriptional regulator [Polaromonas sp. CG_23.6]MDH6184243.1 TetR/AcrR family acrAB operon transcriptional repressor [Polaromonas sp. CG_23.6]